MGSASARFIIVILPGMRRRTASCPKRRADPESVAAGTLTVGAPLTDHQLIMEAPLTAAATELIVQRGQS